MTDLENILKIGEDLASFLKLFFNFLAEIYKKKPLTDLERFKKLREQIKENYKVNGAKGVLMDKVINNDPAKSFLIATTVLEVQDPILESIIKKDEKIQNEYLKIKDTLKNKPYVYETNKILNNKETKTDKELSNIITLNKTETISKTKENETNNIDKTIEKANNETIKKAIEGKKTAKDLRFFASDSQDNLTKEQMNICLEKQETAEDFKFFAKYCQKNLSKEQMDICLEAQKTAYDFGFFAHNCKENLDPTQLAFCQKKANEADKKIIKKSSPINKKTFTVSETLPLEPKKSIKL